MPEDVPLCPECLAQVHPDWPFCTHCGSRLNLGSTSAPVPALSGLNRPPIAPSGPYPVCGNCGAAVDTSGSFCWKCGVPLLTGWEPFIPAHPEPADQPGTAAESLTAPVASVREELGRASSRPARRTPASRRSVIGGTLLLLGVVLLIVSLFMGWYAYSLTASATASDVSVTISGTTTPYPLNQITEAMTCVGWSGCAQFNITSASSYSQGGDDGIGALYDIVAGFVIAGIVIGVAAAALAFSGGRRSGLAGTLAVLAIILVALAPTLLFASQPTVISSQGAPYTGPGSVAGASSPRTSFFGSCSGTGCGLVFPSGTTDSGSWGPSTGWYLSFVAVAPLIAGLLLVRRQRKGPVEPSVYDLAS
jgi:hypothetical protein